jgi:hypothetical protein
VYLSTNYGISWARTSLNDQAAYSLAVNGPNVFAGTEHGIYRSTNYGSTWTQTLLLNDRVISLAVIGTNIFSGSFIYGVHLSTDNGITWVQKNEGLFNYDYGIFSFAIAGNFVYAGTSRNSVWVRPLGELVGLEPLHNQIPESFSLFQNYPNPFNPSTKIKFQIPLNKGGGFSRGLFTRLTIYDLLGREVATLVNEQLKPGTYEVEWPAPSGDGTDYPSGVYFYKLTTETFSESKRMILLK